MRDRRTPWFARSYLRCGLFARYRIWKALSDLPGGPANQNSCHLDAVGVASVCKAIFDQISMSDLVVLNKFGKLERMGEGLAAAFELAISAGKPVLTTVSDRHRDAWRTFAPDASFLPADKAALQNWWRAVHVPLRHPQSRPWPS
jgi:hypothetical protein